MRAIDHDNPVYSRERIEKPRGARPTDQEVDALLDVLRKKHAYQKIDLYGEPAYGRSIEVEIFIVEVGAASAPTGVGWSDKRSSRPTGRIACALVLRFDGTWRPVSRQS